MNCCILIAILVSELLVAKPLPVVTGARILFSTSPQATFVIQPVVRLSIWISIPIIDVLATSASFSVKPVVVSFGPKFTSPFEKSKLSKVLIGEITETYLLLLSNMIPSFAVPYDKTDRCVPRLQTKN